MSRSSARLRRWGPDEDKQLREMVEAGKSPTMIALRLKRKEDRGLRARLSRRGFCSAAWAVFLANRTEADFQAWRDERDWTAEKYRRFDRHERMPPDWRASGLEATFRRSNPVAARSPPRHP